MIGCVVHLDWIAPGPISRCVVVFVVVVCSRDFQPLIDVLLLSLHVLSCAI